MSVKKLLRSPSRVIIFVTPLVFSDDRLGLCSSWLVLGDSVESVTVTGCCRDGVV